MPFRMPAATRLPMSFRTFPQRIAIVLIASSLVGYVLRSDSVHAADAFWPQFRGPSGDGVVPNCRAPEKWSDQEGITWKSELPGKAWSSPVVADGKII